MPGDISAREIAGTGPSSACRHLLPACGEKGICRTGSLNLHAAFGMSPLPVYGERVRVRGSHRHEPDSNGLEPGIHARPDNSWLAVTERRSRRAVYSPKICR
jgi:hypothetical protein